ncbi:MAG: Uncharacterised protein [Cellulomonadaceae bacterium TMED98]|nr:MAG: Uncharacterised protein [Cellulomonadaceae bacterium TMED98]
MPPGQSAVLELSPQHGRKQPGANDVLTLAAQVVGKDQIKQLVVSAPATSNLRGQAGRRPGVHDVGLSDKPTRCAALRLIESWRGLRRRVDG